MKSHMRPGFFKRASAFIVLALLVAILSAHHAGPLHTDRSDLQISLGQRLFNDPGLSADGRTRCASCHQPDKNYTDGRPVAIGVFGRRGTRNTPSLMGIGEANEVPLFWDGRRTHLQQAVLDPLTNPVELGLNDTAAILTRVMQDPSYRAEFEQAFPSNGQLITIDEISLALSAYVQSLNKQPSAYDHYILGNRSALSPLEQVGLSVFKGKGQCVECHRLDGFPAALTDHDFHRTGVGMDTVTQQLPTLTEDVVQRSLHDRDVGIRVATHADEAQLGRFNVTLDPADIGLFRTPSLRGVATTAPYMHDGSIATLDEAIDREVYYRGLQAGRPLNLSIEDRRALKAFLGTL